MSSRDEYVNALKASFSTLGKKVVMNYLVSKVPFLGLGFVNPIFGYLVGLGLEALTTEAETQVFFKFIDFRVGAQAKDFEKAAAENYEAQRGTDAERKKVAEANLRRALRELVSITS